MPTFERGDMWSAFETSHLFLITTNGTVKSNGALVMGRGIAKQARERLSRIDKVLGWQIRHQKGRSPYGLLIPLNWPAEKVGAFQVKEKYNADADPRIIAHAVQMLLTWAHEHPDQRIDLNFPGIGAGRLARGAVVPLLLHLPDNVHIWEYPASEKDASTPKTIVVNRHSIPKYDVYIGRAGYGEDGYFGNPVQQGKPCPVCGKTHAGKGSTLACYKQYLWDRVNRDPAFRTRLWGLQGKSLACFCKPSPCHGDVVVTWLEAGGPYLADGVVKRMADTR